MDINQAKLELVNKIQATNDPAKINAVLQQFGLPPISASGNGNGASGDGGNMSREEFLKRLRG
ncbi:MAG: hypothetical protein ACOCZ8_00120 [Bacteroidota bacterium]